MTLPALYRFCVSSRTSFNCPASSRHLFSPHHALSLFLGFQGFNVQLPDLPSSSFRYPSPAGLPPGDGAFVDCHNDGQLLDGESGLFPEALKFAWCHVITSSPTNILRREYGAADPVGWSQHPVQPSCQGFHCWLVHCSPFLLRYTSSKAPSTPRPSYFSSILNAFVFNTFS